MNHLLLTWAHVFFHFNFSSFWFGLVWFGLFNQFLMDYLKLKFDLSYSMEFSLFHSIF